MVPLSIWKYTERWQIWKYTETTPGQWLKKGNLRPALVLKDVWLISGAQIIRMSLRMHFDQGSQLMPRRSGHGPPVPPLPPLGFWSELD